jgi:homoisocitrate dehydrogenase
VAGYRSAIITMRQKLDLYSNIRPVRSLPVVSPRQDVNFLIVRENTEGLYSGLERMEPSGERAVAERVITRKASMKIGRRAMEVLATQNRKCLSIVHKANILPVTDGLFRDCIRESVANSGIQCDVNELLVDTAAMKIITEPDKLDVLVTTNLFGDILSDEAAYWGGGIGLAPSLNWGDGIALAEPVHGSAPDITGKGIANPIATILSASMLVRYMWNLPDISNRIDTAVESALLEDALTQNGKFIQGLTTREITRAILERLR